VLRDKEDLIKVSSACGKIGYHRWEVVVVVPETEPFPRGWDPAFFFVLHSSLHNLVGCMYQVHLFLLFFFLAYVS
jgi:hypothetical protein